MSAARIWIVDDDRSVRFVLATALCDAGYEVEQFEGSDSALRALAGAAAAALPSLLFTD
ncbi:nitrogen regulation protein NR(I), partial [Lysobacter sp. D1-1-M9]